MKPDNRILIYDPQSGASPDVVMEVLRLFAFQTYPPELRTRENMLKLFDSLSPDVQRHFKVEYPKTTT